MTDGYGQYEDLPRVDTSGRGQDSPTAPSSERTHTPGPWRVEPDGQGCDRVVGPRGTVADTIGNEANARLIAAAPDVLAALKRYVEHYGDPLKVARVAIAKAEGLVPVEVAADGKTVIA